MWRTRVGYAGGTTPDPRYTAMSDYTESIAVDFDPRVISYEQLMREFWKAHNPFQRAWSRQYRNAAYWLNNDQRKVLESMRNEIERTKNRKVETAIEPLTHFYMAEDYHQKYYLRNDRKLAGKLIRIYGDGDAFANSTVAMRLNALIDGQGTRQALNADLSRYGLSDDGRKRAQEYGARLSR